MTKEEKVTALCNGGWENIGPDAWMQSATGVDTDTAYEILQGDMALAVVPVGALIVPETMINYWAEKIVKESEKLRLDTVDELEAKRRDIFANIKNAERFYNERPLFRDIVEHIIRSAEPVGLICNMFQEFKIGEI